MNWTHISEGPEGSVPANALGDALNRLTHASSTKAEPLLVEASSWDDARRWARAIRGLASLTWRPLFLRSRPSGPECAWTAALFDGIGLETEAREARARAIFEQARVLKHVARSACEGVAQYLACRPAARLEPLRDWSAPSYYRYPLVEVLLAEGEDASSHVETWRRRHILEVEAIQDRLRACDCCGSAHLSHVDVCPSCASIDIGSARLLHCFTCGHVAHQADFSIQQRLECPKCHVGLRHIGVDYDRPLEQTQCRKCKTLFVDADVRSQCMACGAASTPERLPVKVISSYRLTGTGVMLARQGDLAPVLSGLDTVDFLAPALFERLLAWQMEIARRHPKVHRFALVGLRVSNLEELASDIGRSGAATLVEGYCERLRAALRATDLYARSDEDQIWFLALLADEAGAQRLLSRVNELGNATRQSSGASLTVSTTVGIVPDDGSLPNEASQLLSVMSSRLECQA